MKKRFLHQYRRPRRFSYTQISEWECFCRAAAKLSLAKRWLEVNPQGHRYPTMIAHGYNKPQLHEDSAKVITSDFLAISTVDSDLCSQTQQLEAADEP